MWMLLKKLKFEHFTKKVEVQKNQTIGPLVSFRMFQKSMKDACIFKFILILINYYQGINVVFVKVLAHNISFYYDKKNENFTWQQTILGAYSTDLSKAFDCIAYHLLIAKLNAYGFDQGALKLIHRYLWDRLQKVKLGSSLSKELDTLCGVPQGSILGPLLFHINICDLFFIDVSSDIANHADDTTLYECAPYNQKLIENLELTIYTIFNWFKYNNFKANATKCHFFLSPYHSATININGLIIKSSNSQKLLGVTIGSNFTFEEHINSPCWKSSQKLITLSRISQYLSPNKKCILFKTFVTSQFDYCPLVSMCHSRTLNNRINNIHHRALRIIYQDKKSSFEELLQKDKYVSVHIKICNI